MQVFSGRGFTLLEVVVSIAIFSLLTLAITEIFLVNFRYKNTIYDQLSTQAEGRAVLNTMVNELRVANYSSLGAYPIESADQSQLTFFANLDADQSMERVRYFITTSTLRKGIIKPAGSPLMYDQTNEIITDVLHNVILVTSTPFFSYYDDTYSGPSSTPLADTPNITLVRLVGIKFILDKNPSSSPTSLTLETKVAIRNLKSN